VASVFGGVNSIDIQIISEMYEEDGSEQFTGQCRACKMSEPVPALGTVDTGCLSSVSQDEQLFLHSHLRLNARLAYHHSKKQLYNHISLDSGLGK
jgi:hypothetical protein